MYRPIWDLSNHLSSETFILFWRHFPQAQIFYSKINQQINRKRNTVPKFFFSMLFFVCKKQKMYFIKKKKTHTHIYSQINRNLHKPRARTVMESVDIQSYILLYICTGTCVHTHAHTSKYPYMCRYMSYNILTQTHTSVY